jgi:sulfur carrier protein
MEIQLNGESYQLATATTIAALVEQLGLGNRRYAVEVNAELIPRSEHAGHQLRAGDRVEIVHAIGGG